MKNPACISAKDIFYDASKNILTLKKKRYILRYNVREKEKTLCIKTDLKSLKGAGFGFRAEVPSAVQVAGSAGIIMGACATAEESGDFPADLRDADSVTAASASSTQATSSW
jgi:hypothetical protein